MWLMIPGAICDVNMADPLSSAGSVLFSTLELPPPGRQVCPLKTESMGCPAGDISTRVVHFLYPLHRSDLMDVRTETQALCHFLIPDDSYKERRQDWTLSSV